MNLSEILLTNQEAVLAKFAATTRRKIMVDTIGEEFATDSLIRSIVADKQGRYELVENSRLQMVDVLANLTHERNAYIYVGELNLDEILDSVSGFDFKEPASLIVLYDSMIYAENVEAFVSRISIMARKGVKICIFADFCLSDIDTSLIIRLAQSVGVTLA